MKKLLQPFLISGLIILSVFTLLYAFTRDWDETTPTKSSEARNIDEYIRYLRIDVRERLAVDHYFVSDDTNVDSEGYHTTIHLIDQDTDPETSIYGGILYGKNGHLYWITPSNDITQVDSMSQADSIYSYMFNDGCIEETALADSSVSTAKLQDSCVNETKLADDCISTAKIQDGAITETKLADSVKPYIYSAVGDTDISTTSDTWLDVDDMTITETFIEGRIFIHFCVGEMENDAGLYAYFRILVDGVEKIKFLEESSDRLPNALSWVEDITSGPHTIKVQWKTSDGTLRQRGSDYKRILTVITGQ